MSTKPFPREAQAGHLKMPNGVVEAATTIAKVFDRFGVSYALGGALALGAHGVPRMTFDVDINVGLVGDAFLSDELTDALSRECGLTFDHPISKVRREANASGFVRGNIGYIKVDIFFPSIDYLDGVMARRAVLPLLGRQVPVVGLNDLVVMKTVFGRTKDFADIESLARHGREPIDREFVAKHVREIMHLDDAEDRLKVLDAHLAKEGGRVRG